MHGSGVRTLIPFRCKTGDNKEIPVEHVGLFSYITYAWLDSFMWKTFRKGIDATTELWTCPVVDTATVNAKRLEELWKGIKDTKGEKATLFSAFFAFIKVRFLVGCILLVFALCAIIFGQAYVYMKVLMYLRKHDDPLWLGVVFVFAMFVANMVYTLLFMSIFTTTHIAGARLRSAALYLVYQKLLKVAGLKGKAAGLILNIFANDGQRIFDGASYLPMLLASPILCIGTTIYAVYLLGWLAMIGFVILLFLFPIQMTIGKCIMKFRARAIVVTDKRVRLMNEILPSAKFVKMYAWEKPLNKVVSDIRKEEHSVIEKANLCTSIAMLTCAIVLATATMATIIVYTLLGHDLTVEQAFTYLVLYGSIGSMLELATMSIRYASEFKVAAGRCQEILELEELEEDPLSKSGLDGAFHIQMTKLCVAWSRSEHHSQLEIDKTKKTSTLKVNAENGIIDEEQEMLDKSDTPRVVLTDINVNIEKGDIVGVVGTVGSGKTAFLYAVLGQMHKTTGHIAVHGNIAFVPQEPWIFNATVQENILFEEEYDAERYSSVISSCCLQPDLDLLPAGDSTEIGERGANLSGGQKQRISLARAVYSNRDIYLLDDPFSALDPDVAQEVYKKVVQGILLGKTVVLVTHHTKFLPECDYIIHIKNGQIIEQGTHNDLLELGGEYTGFISSIPITGAKEEAPPRESVILEDDELDVSAYSDGDAHLETSTQPLNESYKSGKVLVEEEEMYEGAVSKSTYCSYVKAAGGVLAATCVVIIAIVAEGWRAFSYWWLAKWIADGSGNTTVTEGNYSYISDSISDNPNLRLYNLVYGMSLLGILLFFIFRSILLVKVMMKASSTLHEKLFQSVFSSSINFFDTTPFGRILNRFSKDMDELDSGLPPMVDSVLKCIISIVLYLAMIAAIIHWFLVAIPIIAAIFLFVYFVFKVGVRQMKRLQNLCMSPMLGHITSTLHGLDSVRAYGKQTQFAQKCQELLDYTTVTTMLFNFCMRWINIRLSLITSSIVCVTALLLVILRDSVQPEFAAVAIMYASQLSSLFQFFVRSAVESEARFTSAERIQHYIEELEPEEKEPPRFSLPNEWPAKGNVKFTNYHMRYREGLPNVLRGIDFEVKGNEKVGIVGRTGSGKSSLATALFRLVDASDGLIQIDKLNIQQVALSELRSKLSMIPQHPVLFSGTIRTNLDPFKRHIDMELWRALEKCNMKEKVNAMELKLDTPVSVNGDNFSLGERQLICLARVLLRRTRIIILDEATASIDPDTEALIQKSVADCFDDCTLLIIAHRLKTVQECDRVMVMENGKVIEFDKPETLLADSNSKFNYMMKVTNEMPESFLDRDDHSDDAWV